jgi:hypothetical protein
MREPARDQPPAADAPRPAAPATPVAPNPASAPNPAAPLTRGPAPTAAPSTATRTTLPGSTSPAHPSYPGAARGATVTEAPRQGGRRARLTLKRIDPWSMLKFSFVYSLAGLVVLLVAVVALYGIVDAMGVIDSIRSFLHDVEGTKNGGGVAAWLTFGRIFSVALVVGLINVILFTAFATLTAFIYNVCTDLVGGIEVTLAERG